LPLAEPINITGSFAKKWRKVPWGEGARLPISVVVVSRGDLFLCIRGFALPPFQ
jgi:hypothetical protein